ncbi:MAG: HEAT repeat domain-containing protein [bacterium]|nr:HEAT repeat domain-containing protein [bacterium]
MKVTVAAVLLRLGREDGEALLREQSRSDLSRERKAVVSALGDAPSPQGNAILTGTLEDARPAVKIQAVRSLTKAQAVSALPELFTLLDAPNVHLRKAVVTALGEFDTVECMASLRRLAPNAEEALTLRLMAIRNLGHSEQITADSALVAILKQDDSDLLYPTVTVLGERPFRDAQDQLEELLHTHAERRVEWRRIRDEDTRAFVHEENDPQKEQMDDWRQRRIAVSPNRLLEFALGWAFIRIDSDKGIELLEHHISHVREGAWTGLAELPSTETKPSSLQDGAGAVVLLEQLYKKRRSSANPLLRYAAYRAIDKILLVLEYSGGPIELTA